MMNLKRFFSGIILVIGGCVGMLLPTSFSVAQSFGPTRDDLWNRSLDFRMPNYELSLYAKIEPNTYTIYFDGNGNTAGDTSSMNMVYDEEKTLLANGFIRDGYVFIGWSRTKTGTVEYSDQEKVINLTTTNSGEVTLYAQRQSEVPYTVEYYQENVAGTGYDLIETGTMYANLGTGIILTGNTYPGFTLQTGAEVNIYSGGIVPYYYTRNPYDLTIVDRDNTSIITGVKYGADIPLPADPESAGNVFLGWDNLPEDGKMPANDLIITSKRSYGTHTITFDTEGGTVIDPITGNYGDIINKPDNPTKNGYEFIRWEPELPDTIPYEDIVVKAIWKQIGNNGKGWSGGGRKGGTSSDPSGGQQHQSADNQSQGGNNVGNERTDLEVFFAYMWAHDMGIIETSWEDSDPDGYVTRGDMAEMIVKFTQKVLEREIPDVIPRECTWRDANRDWKSPETKVYAEKACALGVMGIRVKNFMPNKILDRAEFGTILSRLLWGDKYDVVNATRTNLYYIRHLKALNDNKIMTEIANPESRKELKKWAWLMLMRSRLENIEEK